MVGLGGFSFKVSADVSSALAELQQLQQSARQSAQQVQAAFRSASVNVNTQQAQAAVAQLGQQVRAVQQGSSTVTIRAEVGQATQSIERLSATARALGDARLNLTVRADGSQQAEQGINRVAAALRAARAGERIAIQVRAEGADAADAAIRRLTADVDRAKQAGARVAINVATTGTQGAAGGFGQQATGGFIQQLTPGLSTAPAVAAGVIAAQAVERSAHALVAAAQASIEYNSRLEQTRNTLVHFTGSQAAANEALARARELATISPFGEQAVEQAQTTFIRVSGGDVERANELTKLTVTLAAAHPERGFEEMQQAIQQLISGDYRAFEDRTNIAFGTVRRLAQQGASGMELYSKAVEAAGGSTELLEKNANTFQARLTTFQSSIQQFGAALGRGSFETISASLGALNDVLKQNRQAWLDAAEAAGRLGAVAAFGPIGIPGVASTAIRGAGAAIRPTVEALGALDRHFNPPEQAAADRPGFEGRQADLTGTQAQLDKQKAALAEQNELLKDIEREHHQIQLEAARVTEEYNKQLIPLRNQVARETAPAFGLESKTAQDEIAVVQARQRLQIAQGPPEQVAAAQGALAQAEAERDVIALRQQRAQIAVEIGQQEQRIAQQTAEIAIRAEERQIQGMQQRAEAASDARRVAIDALRDEQSAAQEVRRDRLEGLQDEIRAHGEARQAALEALRDEAQAARQTRQDELEGIQETIRARRESVSDARDAQQEVERQASEAFSDRERAADSAHTSVMEGYRDEIDSLQEQARASRDIGKSEAERALAALNAKEREFSLQERLNDAQRAVGEATTLKNQLEARRRLATVQHEIDVEHQRAELQDRIDKEKEAQQRRQADIQEQIAAVERKAREEDRTFQHEKAAREEAERVRVRAQQDADRAADRAEKQRERQEDAQVRAQEQANRAQDRAEQAALQQAERAARAADQADQQRLREQQRADAEAQRAEQRQLQAEERAAREADRADALAIRQAQQGLQGRREGIADQNTQDDLERERQHLQNMKEIAEAERAVLDARIKLADLKNPFAVGAATGELNLAQVIADLDKDLQTVISLTNAIKTAPTREQIFNLEQQQAVAQQAIQIKQDAIARQQAELQVEIDASTKRIDELTARIDLLTGPAPGQPGGPAGPALPAGGVAPGSMGAPSRNPAVGNAFTYQSTGAVSPTLLSDQTAEWVKAAQGLAESAWNALKDAFSPSVAHAAELEGEVDQVTVNVGTHWAGVSDQIAAQQAAIQAAMAAAFDPDAVNAVVGQAVSEAAIAWATLVEQLNTDQEAIEEALAAPFDPAGVRGVVEQAEKVASEAWARLDEDLTREAAAIEQALERPFLDFQRRDIPEIRAAFGEDGYATAQAFLAGWERAGINLHIAEDFTRLIKWIGDLCPAFTQTGHNLAVQFQDGWTRAMAGWQPPVPQPAPSYQSQYIPGGSGASRAGGAGDPAISQLPTGNGPAFDNAPTRYVDQGNGQTNIEKFLNGQWQVVGTMPTAGRGGSRGQQIPQARAFGGDVWPNLRYLVGERGPELFTPRQAGAIMPADLTARALAQPAGGYPGEGGVTINGGVTLNLTVTNPVGDADALIREAGPKLVEQFVSALGHAQITQPRAVSNAIPGALGR
jgi:hypothetical protein